MRPPAGRAQLRLLRSRAVRRLARTIRPDVIIERYHNFGGEGALAAKATGARFALEVNAPVIDYPGSPKAALDRALIAQPMRRWRDWQVSQADLIVTPSATILPDGVPADRVLEIEWGADTTRFHPGATGAVPWPRDPSDDRRGVRGRLSRVAWRHPARRGHQAAARAGPHAVSARS